MAWKAEVREPADRPAVARVLRRHCAREPPACVAAEAIVTPSLCCVLFARIASGQTERKQPTQENHARPMASNRNVGEKTCSRPTPCVVIAECMARSQRPEASACIGEDPGAPTRKALAPATVGAPLRGGTHRRRDRRAGRCFWPQIHQPSGGPGAASRHPACCVAAAGSCGRCADPRPGGSARKRERAAHCTSTPERKCGWRSVETVLVPTVGLRGRI